MRWKEEKELNAEVRTLGVRGGNNNWVQGKVRTRWDKWLLWGELLGKGSVVGEKICQSATRLVGQKKD